MTGLGLLYDDTGVLIYMIRRTVSLRPAKREGLRALLLSTRLRCHAWGCVCFRFPFALPVYWMWSMCCVELLWLHPQMEQRMVWWFFWSVVQLASSLGHARCGDVADDPETMLHCAQTPTFCVNNSLVGCWSFYGLLRARAPCTRSILCGLLV